MDEDPDMTPEEKAQKKADDVAAMRKRLGEKEAEDARKEKERKEKEAFDAKGLVEIPDMDIENIVNDTVTEATKDVLGVDEFMQKQDLEGGGGKGDEDPSKTEKVYRKLSDMSAMELLMRDTRAYVAQQKAERELRREHWCATICGILFAVLVQLFLLPIAIISYSVRMIIAAMPARPKKEAKVKPEPAWDPTDVFRQKKGLAEVGKAVTKDLKKDKKNKYRSKDDPPKEKKKKKKPPPKK